ncbi:MAG: LacI family DNA-binding transcriptional regulator [Capsulimonadales bacterium]|nr:LacI family DNA-binding transcriptional regulator [Capsulimonadales bacterium]
MATTMKDVAKQAGVDVSTVSLAMNNDPRIRPETRQRILDIAQELGYQKNFLARGLRSGRSFTIGAVVGYATTFWGEVLAGAQSVLAAHDYHLLLDYAPDVERREEVQIASLNAKRVDGFLIAPSDSDSIEERERILPLYQDLRERQIPFVFVDRFVPGIEADIISADNVSAAFEATNHLIQLGHRHIAYIYAPHRMNTAQRERLDGYHRALGDAGLTPIPFETKPCPERSQEGLVAAQELLNTERGQAVSAVLAATDNTAMGVLRALHDAGRPVPESIAVISFGGTFTADFLQPPLTTMTLPMRELGRQAAKRLLERIAGDVNPYEHRILPTELVIRASCGTRRPDRLL